MRDYDYRPNDKDDRIQRIKDRRALIYRMEEEAALRRKSELSIGASDDAFEQHADAVANKIVSGEDASGLVKNQPPSDNSLQTKSESDTPEITDQFQSSLNSSKGGGQNLDAVTQNEIGSKMGTDLSDVKIHTDSTAHEMSESINAKAFTHGQDIYFKQGNYDTSSTEGKSLLAHELTHTVQQKGGVQAKVQREPQERPVLTAEQDKYLRDLGYNPDNEPDHFLIQFVNWWKSRLELPNGAQIDFLNKYSGLDLNTFTERQLKDLKSLLDLAETAEWVLTYPQYNIYTLSIADQNIGSLYLLEDNVSSFGSIAFFLRGEYPGPPVFFYGNFGYVPLGLSISVPKGTSPGDKPFTADLISIDVTETGKGMLKNKKGMYDYRFFKSALFKSYNDKQLWYTLNKDPQYGFVIGGGVTGQSVHVIQDALQKLNPAYTIDAAELKSWKYGSSTTATVRQFQYEYDVEFGVEEEGRAGAARKLEKDTDVWSGSLARQNAVTSFEKQYGKPNLDTDGITGSKTLDALDKALVLREQRSIEDQQIKNQKLSDANAQKNNEKSWENIATWQPGSGPEIAVVPVPPMNYSNLRGHFIDPSLIEFTKVSQGSFYNPLSLVGIGKEQIGVDRVFDPTVGTKYQVKYSGIEVGFFTVRFVGTQTDGQNQVDAIRKFAKTFPPAVYPEKYPLAFTIGVEGPIAPGTVHSDNPRDLGLISDIYAYGFPGYKGGPTASDVAGVTVLELGAAPYLVNAIFTIRNGPVNPSVTGSNGRISPGSSNLRPPGYGTQNGPTYLDWAKISGIVRDASKGKGNFGLGTATEEETVEAGKSWVGANYRVSSGGKAWISEDGLRQFRPPSFKPKLGFDQANLQSRSVPEGEWQSNGHIDILK